MTLLSLLGRIMRYFLLRPETLFLLCISLALWSYFFHTDEVKTIVKSSRDAVKMVKGKVAEMMQNDRLGGLNVLDAEFSKTWEFKNNNVAVYSIQGRRDHMEDRFEVLTDIINKSHPSIFGIFDGHGGEVGRVGGQCPVKLPHQFSLTWGGRLLHIFNHVCVTLSLVCHIQTTPPIIDYLCVNTSTTAVNQTCLVGFLSKECVTCVCLSVWGWLVHHHRSNPLCWFPMSANRPHVVMGPICRPPPLLQRGSRVCEPQP